MFDKTRLKQGVGLLALLSGGASLAHASEMDEDQIPVTITISDVRAGDVPLYISIQTKETYQSMHGEGGILRATNSGNISRTFYVKAPGEYAASLWHDLDGDGRFSMTETFEILDGWGSSGTIPRGVQPTFEQAKFAVPSGGASTKIEMIYPSGE